MTGNAVSHFRFLNGLKNDSLFVMPGLVPGIHVLWQHQERRGWPGRSPAMTSFATKILILLTICSESDVQEAPALASFRSIASKASLLRWTAAVLQGTPSIFPSP